MVGGQLEKGWNWKMVCAELEKGVTGIGKGCDANWKMVCACVSLE